MVNQLGRKNEAKKPIPFPIDIDTVAQLAKQYPAPYDNLFRICYLYGLRINEALALSPKDFTRSTDNYGRPALIAQVMTEKNRQTPLRVVPAVMAASDKATPFQQIETQITKAIDNYIASLPRDALLFPGITRQKAFYYFNKYSIDVRALVVKERKIIELPGFKLHPHYLRHVRLTHLVEEYNYSTIALMQYAGWTDPRPASVYLQLDWRHLSDAMKPQSWLEATE